MSKELTVISNKGMQSAGRTTLAAAGKSTGKLAKAAGALNAPQALIELIAAYGSYRKTAAREKTRRQEISSQEAVELNRIKAQKDTLMGMIDHSFGERKMVIEALLNMLDNARECGDMAACTAILGYITQIIVANPASEIVNAFRQHAQASLQEPGQQQCRDSACETEKSRGGN